MRRGTGSRKARGRAKPPAARRSSEDDRSGSRDLAKRLAEALDQQTATAEILRVISRSPGDLQPVLDAVAENAARLCNARDVIILRTDGDVLRMAASVGSLAVPVGTDLRSDFGFPLTRGSVSGRAVVDRTTLHVRDLAAESDAEFPTGKDLQRRFGHRTMLAAPLLRDDAALGVICVFRTEVRPFSDSQIALLETFADQAVIAIENVRLVTELETRNRALAEALERETATSAILRVISSSPTDVQPVLDAVARSAARLCAARDAVVLRLDGDVLRRAAHTGPIPSPPGLVIPVTGGRVAGRAVLDRQPVHVVDAQAEWKEFPETSAFARERGFRTILSVPLLREGVAIGTIDLRRSEVQPFTKTQVELLKTFADQAVIAIENVRLFTELQEKNRALTQAHAQVSEALAQQTATADILRVISSSPIDVQPIFSAIAESAARLTGGVVASVYEFDGSLVHLRVIAPSDYPHADYFRRNFPRPPAPDFAAGRVILDRAVFHRADLQNDPDTPELTRDWARGMGLRSVLWVPMLREGEPIGVIGAVRREAGLFADDEIRLLQTFADQAVIAIENVRLFTALQEKNQALTAAHARVTEALEQQTATSEILRVISQSPTDVQPVFAAVAASAARLCDAFDAAIHRIDGDVLRMAAHEGPIQPDAVLPLAPGTLAGRVVRERQARQVADMQAEPATYPVSSEFARNRGFRTILAVPLVCGNEAVGTITIRRTEVRPFSDRQVALLKTFADQAVIAIENVRLFTELQEKNRALTAAHARVTEALEQQTATGEILRVISSSPTDLQPVFDTIVESAQRLLGARTTSVFRRLADKVHLAATTSTGEAADATYASLFPMSLDDYLERYPFAERDWVNGTVIHVPDVDLYSRSPEIIRRLARARGFRSLLQVPMRHAGHVIGLIGVTRRGTGAFADAEIALLQTFADQAVIAIENVHLFKELQASNKDLKEALEQQTATSEILGVIARSPTDVQPVLDTLVENAVTLGGADRGVIFRWNGDSFRLAANYGHSGEFVEFVTRHPPSLGRGSAVGRAALERQTVHIHDVFADPDYERPARSVAEGYRTVLGIPMLRGDEFLGLFALHRHEVKPFTERQIKLMETFADQAVIAIENVRLFTELQARTQELSRSVGQLTALGEVGRAVSSTLDLETVLTTIVSRAVQLAGLEAGAIYEYDEAAEVFHLRATENLPEAFLEIARPLALPKGEGATGRLAVTREPVQIPDIAAPGAYHGRLRDVLLGLGHRALLAVPLVSEDHVVGGLVVNRRQPGEFPSEVIELLRTFATQSALAIQNARLFQEIEDKSRQLEVASRHKSEFLANMSHELRTPLNAIIGFSEVLAERMFGELNDKQEEYLKDIHTSGQHLLSLINDILDLSKVEAGRMELELTDIDLAAAIDNALTLVRERAGRRGIAVHQAVDRRLGQVRGDERKIKQVLLNLLSNALKFTPEGGRVDVRASIIDGLAEISVTDTGVGIAPEDQVAVFEEFRQVGMADKKVEGTGLGLALSRKFVELHGGRIWLTSQPGQGSTFTFTLPCA